MSHHIKLEDIAKRLAQAIPAGFPGVGSELERTFRGILQGAFEKMNLVSREEFEVQRSVLAKTREKLDKLEARMAELEQLSQQR